jgi:HEAT repeat protein
MRYMSLVCLAVMLTPQALLAFAPTQRPLSVVSFNADLTQIIVANARAWLVCELSVKNEGDVSAKLTADDLQLWVGNHRLANVIDPPDSGELRPFIRRDGAVKQESFRQLPLIKNGRLAAGETATGWICFDLSPLGAPEAALECVVTDPCFIVGALGSQRFRFDLTAYESAALRLTRRPSKLDRNVSVIEVSSRVNSLNVGTLLKEMASLANSDDQYILHLKGNDILLEELAAGRWSRPPWHSGSMAGRGRLFGRAAPMLTQASAGMLSPIVIGELDAMGQMTQRAQVHVEVKAISEAVATVQILGRRPFSGLALVDHLRADDGELRTAAATNLAGHLREKGIVDALVFALRDDEATVRAAAARSLGAGNEIFYDLVQKPTAVDALLAALRDPDPQVREAAAWAAATAAGDRAAEGLIGLLDDGNVTVAIAACRALGNLRCVTAQNKLKKLQSHPSEWLRNAAVDALDSIGAMSQADAALARLHGTRYVGGSDVDFLVRSADPRLVPALFELIKQRQPDDLRDVVQVLAELRRPDAFAPLIAVLEKYDVTEQEPRWHLVEEWHTAVRALGSLGDQHAIEPIRRVLAQTPETIRDRLPFYGALLDLKAPNALEGLPLLLDQTFDPAGVSSVLDVLIQYEDPQILPIFERLLDQEAYCREAAEKISYVSLPEVTALLRRRLANSENPCASALHEGLSQNPLWLCRQEESVVIRKSPLAGIARSGSGGGGGRGGSTAPVASDPRIPAGRRRRGFVPATNGSEDDTPKVTQNAIAQIAERLERLPTHDSSEVAVSPDLTQFVQNDQGCHLFIRLALENRSDSLLEVNPAQILLKLGDRWLPPVLTGNSGFAGAVVLEGATGRRISAQWLPRFKDCELAARQKLEGWLSFDVSQWRRQLDNPGELAQMPCQLAGQIGNGVVRLDLRAHEDRVLTVTQHPLELASDVSVVEVSGQLNAFNSHKLFQVLRKLPDNAADVVFVLQGESWLVDAVTREQWQTWLRNRGPGDRYELVLPRPRASGRELFGDVARYSFVNSPSPFVGVGFPGSHMVVEAAGEMAVAAAILGRRKGTNEKLTRLLASDDGDARGAAATALASHLDESGVVSALAEAGRDADPAVRLAAIESLGSSNSVRPADERGADSPATQSLLEAMADSDAALRRAAVGAASKFPSDRMQKALLSLVNDHDFYVQLGACVNLARLHSEAALARIRWHAARRDNGGVVGYTPMKSAAIGALEELEELSHDEALLARLDTGYPGPRDLEAAARLNDPRVAPLLIALVEDQGFRGYHGGHAFTIATQALMTLGEKSAVGPLGELISRGLPPHEAKPVLEVLARLGDASTRPNIRRALRKAPAQWRERLPYYGALAALGDADALATLAALVKGDLPDDDAVDVFRFIAKSGSAKVVDHLEPMLDDAKHCRHAAWSLSQVTSPHVMRAFEERLTAADYPFGKHLLTGLADNPNWLEGPDGQSLLRKALLSVNETTKAAAERIMNGK